MLFAVALAGAAGAAARYLVDYAIAESTDSVFPWGTFVINVTGSLALGIVVGLALHHGLPSTTRIVAGTGFLGAYTTFSTFTYETLQLIEQSSRAEAVLNVIASVAAGTAAAAGGLVLTAW